MTLSTARAVCVERLALWLSPPSVYGEFSPGAPFEGSEERTLEPPWRMITPRSSSPAAAFGGAVAAITRGHARCAVSFSGGLDSLAVLVAAVDRLGADRVIAVVSEMTDDSGHSNLPVVKRVLTGFGISCPVEVVSSTDDPAGSPEWHASGPRLDAMPNLNRLISEVAAGHRATILLTGGGSDELVGAPRYLLARLIKRRRWSAARMYMSDTAFASRRACGLEALGLAARILPPRLRADLFLATEAPELLSRDVSPVVGAGLRSVVRAWSRSWAVRIRDLHARYHPDWATMGAWDAMFPLSELDTPGPIPWASPFLHSTFRSYVSDTPLADRYDGRHATPYFRAKALVMRLLPRSGWGALPERKQIFAAALSDHHMRVRAAPVCAAYGLIDRDELVRARDPLIVARTARIEEWLREALQRGYAIHGPSPGFG